MLDFDLPPKFWLPPKPAVVRHYQDQPATGMLPGIVPVVSTPARSAFDIVSKAGLSSNLKVCLDSGDNISYPGTGQVWSDRTSQAANFNLGATATSEASDPIFNGAAGSFSSSAYWGFDGGDYFTLAATNPTFINNLHKGGAQFAICAWIQFATASDSNLIFGTLGSSGANAGARFRGTAAGKLNFNPGSNQTQFTSTLSYSTATWVFVAVSINESGGVSSGVFRHNATSETFNPTYSAPSASNAAATAQICAQGASTTPIPSGGKLAIFLLFEGTVITDANLLAIYNGSKDRFGL